VNESAEESVDQFIIYAGYGEVMHRMQTLEMSLWLIQARNIKAGSTLEQGMAKVEKWNGTTLGELMRGMKNQTHWPIGLVDKLMKAIDHRNYLAHHYLREYFVIKPSEQNRERAARELAAVSVFLEELIDELDAHAAALGVLADADLEQEARAEIDRLRPKDWLGIPGR
jgi:hypothetical protein